MTPLSIFLLAGEVSGDLHGEKLVSSLKLQFPTARLFGVGGPKMRQAGLEIVMEMEKFQVMGFVDVFLALPRLIRQFFFLRSLLLKEQPDVVIFIDYPGLNLALAKSLFKRSFKGKLCHYICPSVWAWGKKRIPKMEKILDQLFVIFPFEKDLFDSKKIQVHYVGHPLVQKKISPISSLSIPLNHRVIALFPGSRQKEITRNFPLQIKVAKKLLSKYPDLIFAVSVAQPIFISQLEKILTEQNFSNRDRILFIPSTEHISLMDKATFAIAKSGTNNLELALQKVPTIVTYGISRLDFFIAKKILNINLSFYCIVNILAGKMIYPELIGPQFTAKALFSHADHYLSSEEALNECREKCIEMSKLLSNKNPSQEIALAIKNLLQNEERSI